MSACFKTKPSGVLPIFVKINATSNVCRPLSEKTGTVAEAAGSAEAAESAEAQSETKAGSAEAKTGIRLSDKAVQTALRARKLSRMSRFNRLRSTACLNEDLGAENMTLTGSGLSSKAVGSHNKAQTLSI